MTNKKTRKVYGRDKYDTYSIHKSTLISYDTAASCKMLKKVFGNAISGCQSPPDPALKKRGVRWVRFLTGGKAEFHFVPPFTLNQNKTLRRMISREQKIDPLRTQFFENHIGIYVSDLTPVIIKILKLKIPCHLNKRADGMYQFYFPIKGCIDYLDVDSLKVDFEKINKIDPDFRAYTFKENMNLVHKYEGEFIKKTKSRRSINSRLYLDPHHGNAPRRVALHSNGIIHITGRDSPRGKIWRVTGKVDKHNQATLDFSKKGGPKDIKAKITKDKIIFGDGNAWTSVYNIH